MASPQNGFHSNTTPVSDCGDVLLDSLTGEYKFAGSLGSGTQLTYSFPWATSEVAAWANNPSYSPLNEPAAGLTLNAMQQAAFRAALASWSAVANVRFFEVPDTADSVGDIRVAWTGLPNPPSDAWTWQSADYWANAGDIWLSAPLMGGQPDADWQGGGFSFMSLIHELGHALWLEHPFEDITPLPSAWDTQQYTVMSYTEHPRHRFVNYHPAVTEPDGSATVTWDAKPVYPSTPMLLDVAAIQRLYGANWDWHAGDDMYAFSADAPFIMTLWDGGGTDTISAGNFTTDCLIDLREGHFSSLSILPDPSITGLSDPPLAPPLAIDYDGTDNLAIAFGARIENAVGGRGDDGLIGNALANQLTGGAGNDTLDGGAGIDTAVYNAARAACTVTQAAGGWSVSSPTEGVDSLVGIERLQFSDATVALDINGTAGQAYRVYQAAFDRTPDLAGLGFWIHAMDNGASLRQVAEGFVGSPEFKAVYGANPSSAQIVGKMYTNVLHRTGEPAGLAYWIDVLDSHRGTAADVLAGFSDSAENQAGLMGVMSHGFAYTPYG